MSSNHSHPSDDPYLATTEEWGWDSPWTPCGYCETPGECRDNFNTCWRETHTEMSE